MRDGSCRGQLWTTEGAAMFALSDSLWLTVLSYQQQQHMKYRNIGIPSFLCSYVAGQQKIKNNPLSTEFLFKED